MKKQSETIRIIGVALKYEKSSKTQVNSAGTALLSISPNVKDIEDAFLAAKAFIDCHAADPDLTEEMINKHQSYQLALEKLENSLDI